MPEIAYAHHEKLDGTGYPRKLKGDEIPRQSRMMTISDIYDALVAWDRPYKKAVSEERAHDILCDEARRGQGGPGAAAGLPRGRASSGCRSSWTLLPKRV